MKTFLLPGDIFDINETDLIGLEGNSGPSALPIFVKSKKRVCCVVKKIFLNYKDSTVYFSCARKDRLHSSFVLRFNLRKGVA